MEFKKIAGNEFSRLLPPDQLSLLPLDLKIAANPEECAALARRFGLLDLARLSARLWIAEGAEPGHLLVKGSIEAQVTQACVVTLAPVETRVDELFEAAFADPAQVEAAATLPEELPEEGNDLPEPLAPEGLDLGELAAQQLAVAIDPYPRAPDADAVLQALTAAREEGTERSPFDVLRDLRGKD